MRVVIDPTLLLFENELKQVQEMRSTFRHLKSFQSEYLRFLKPFLSHVSQVSSQFSQNLSSLVLLSLVDFGLVKLDGLVQLILVEYGLG